MRGGEAADWSNVAEVRILLHDTLLTADKLAGPFLVSLHRCGWSTEKVVVEALRSRAAW
jgi:hypothetical protein